MTKSDVHEYIRRHKLGVLSTVTAAGEPQAALVGFAITPECELVFDTVKSTRKYPNLVARPACSLVIGLEGPATVQYEGIAEELKGDRLAAYQEIYFETWPDGPNRLSWPGIVYFVVRPKWIRYSDFAADPVLIQEFSF